MRLCFLAIASTFLVGLTPSVAGCAPVESNDEIGSSEHANTKATYSARTTKYVRVSVTHCPFDEPGNHCNRHSSVMAADYPLDLQLTQVDRGFDLTWRYHYGATPQEIFGRELGSTTVHIDADIQEDKPIFLTFDAGDVRGWVSGFFRDALRVGSTPGLAFVLSSLEIVEKRYDSTGPFTWERVALGPKSHVTLPCPNRLPLQGGACFD